MKATARRVARSLLFSFFVLSSSLQGVLSAQSVNRDAQILKGFTDRVQAYVDLHRKLEATLPPLRDDSTPEQINAHQQALAKMISEARVRASRGDLFTSDIRRLLRRNIAAMLQRPGGSASLDDLAEATPIKIRLEVNARYPADVPLTSVPPNLLRALPRLPDEVEYRFVQRDLILRDTHANVIVDFMTRARP
jgi:hypothetical protein